jgi:hypothetical protein
MTNPTSNFGWQMPTPTDLVTDLPADFEVFGQAVDTSMADLKGGTTGQILSKATNTDMDFTWITNDVGDITAVNVTAPITGGGSSGAVSIGVSAASTSASGVVQLSDSTSTTSSVLASTPTATKSAYDLAAAAVPKSTVTTAGDVIYATGSSAVTRLAIGTAGQVLTVNTAATAPAWSTPDSSTFNPVINSCFDVAQRGTSVAVGAAFTYTLDRWQAYRSALATGATVSRVATGDTTNLPNVQYAARVQRDSGNTGTGAIVFYQSFESTNSIPFAGKQVTFSFYARKGANYSAASSTLVAQLYTGTGTDQNLGSAGFTGSAVPVTTSPTLTTTWQRFTATGTLSSSATQIGLSFDYTPVGTAGAADYFEITGVQIDIASVAQPVRRNSQTIASEIATCQRYFYVFGYGFTTSSQTTTSQMVNSGWPVKMRSNPTLSIFNSSGNFFEPGVGVRSFTISSLSPNATSNGFVIETTTTSSGVLTVKQVAWLSDNFAASAEL